MSESHAGRTEPQHAEATRDLSRLKIDLAAGGRDSWIVEGVLPPSALVELGAEATVIAPGSAKIIISKEDTLWRVRGELEATIELSCSRCLSQFRLTLMVNPDRFFAVGKDPANAFGQSEMEEDVVYIESGEFSILRFTEEELILVLPMIPLCNDDCFGLCQNCGADKNLEACSCPNERKENPFAILGSVKLNS